MGYIDWRIGGFSCDVDEDFEQFDNELLQIIESDTFSASDQYIVSRLSTDVSSGNNDLIDTSSLLEE